ncbi:site-specific integrase [Hydrogenivirga sp. 128-5-R1-1]|uniref:tyrosine-type recombinase/integrase n=1 Tax=Hydrogenivirga sp. 128-5-R1-1 TaxID=392423 RepID=UPI00015EFB7C|nr:site-specific integrase [Hydrogenivirga sp. 128-5-R1-1]EDP73293.1 phage integrase family protein [Hydrogenivirga sp. 128-5-R1-1]
MRLFKRENGIYYVEFERGKKRSLKTKDKALAQRLFNQLKREYLKGKIILLSEGKKIKLSEFIEEYLEWCRENRSDETFKKARYVLQKLKDHTGDIYIKALTKKHLDEYVSTLLAQGISRTTINIHIRTIKSALTKAVEWEYVQNHPLEGYKQLKVHQTPPRFLLPEDIAKVEKVIDDEFWLFVFRLFVYTGMRLGEIHKLRWKHIDLNRNVIKVEKTKTFQSRVIPIHPKLRAELEARTPAMGKVVPYAKPTIEHKLKNCFKKAGFKDLRIHDLRHTFASLMVMAGVDLKTVQELLGHQSYRTTEIYAHLSPQHLHEAIKKFPI